MRQPQPQLLSEVLVKSLMPSMKMGVCSLYVHPIILYCCETARCLYCQPEARTNEALRSTFRPVAERRTTRKRKCNEAPGENANLAKQEQPFHVCAKAWPNGKRRSDLYETPNKVAILEAIAANCAKPKAYESVG